MTIKILEPPSRKGDSFIVSVDGHLRIIDPQPQCKGYQNGCICTECLERQLDAMDLQSAAACECDHPIRDVEAGECWKCGKQRPALPTAA